MSKQGCSANDNVHDPRPETFAVVIERDLLPLLASRSPCAEALRRFNGAPRPLRRAAP